MFRTQLMIAGTVSLAVALIVGTAGVLAYQPVGTGTGESKEVARATRIQTAYDQPEEEADPTTEAADRKRSVYNLKIIMLAMHGYHDIHFSFPPAAIYDKNGKALLSWRVMLLPSLDYATKGTSGEALYRKFKLDEPWDSEHNKKLLAEMPKEYAPVRGKMKERYSTYYQGFTGKGAVFEGKKGVSLLDVAARDGTSYTIAIVEAADPVAWTRPVDLSYEDDKPLPKLGGLFKDVIHAGLCDGSIRTLKRDYDEKTMRLAITYNDGQVIDLSKIEANK